MENSSNNHDFLTPMQWIPPLIRGAQNIYKWCSTLSHLISWQNKTEYFEFLLTIKAKESLNSASQCFTDMITQRSSIDWSSATLLNSVFESRLISSWWVWLCGWLQGGKALQARRCTKRGVLEYTHTEREKRDRERTTGSEKTQNQRSANEGERTVTLTGDWAFSLFGPKLWNSQMCYLHWVFWNWI